MSSLVDDVFGPDDGPDDRSGLVADGAPWLSVVTCLYNRLDLTRPFLQSLADTLSGVDHEVILVDDLSSDGTREFLATLGPPYRVVLNETRSGFARNCNRGVSLARGTHVALLNNDVLLTEGWLEPMRALLDANDSVGVVGNLQIDPRTGLLDHAGIAFHRDGSTFHSFKHRAGPPSGVFREMNAVSAACILMRREIYDAVGGFDEAYLNGSEDVDLCLRLREAGYRVVVANTSRVYHYVSSSPGRMTHVDRNLERLQARWGARMRELGAAEWACEYVHRYAREPWRARPLELLEALARCAAGSVSGNGPRH